MQFKGSSWRIHSSSWITHEEPTTLSWTQFFSSSWISHRALESLKKNWQIFLRFFGISWCSHEALGSCKKWQVFLVHRFVGSSWRSHEALESLKNWKSFFLYTDSSGIGGSWTSPWSSWVTQELINLSYAWFFFGNSWRSHKALESLKKNRQSLSHAVAIFWFSHLSL
jgi:hypothetical protein